MGKFKPVIVRLLDMAYNTGAHDWEDLKWFGLVELEVVGWLVEEREDCLIVAKEINRKEKDLRHLSALPKKMILEVKYLRSK